MTNYEMLNVENFDEEWYLEKYPDVKRAIKGGKLESGYAHYIDLGKLECREYQICSKNTSEQLQLSHEPFRYFIYNLVENGELPKLKEMSNIGSYLTENFLRKRFVKC
jgi:hypothetical protein